MESPGIATKVTNVMPGDKVVFNWSMSGGYDDARMQFFYLNAEFNQSTGMLDDSNAYHDTEDNLHENCDWCARSTTYTWYVPRCIVTNSVITVKLTKSKKNWFGSGYNETKEITTELKNGYTDKLISFGPSKVYALCTSDSVTLSIASENPDTSIWQGVWHVWNHVHSQWTRIHTGDTYSIDYGQPGNGGDGGYVYKVIYERKDGGCAFSMHGFICVYNVPNVPPIPRRSEVFCDLTGGITAECSAPNTYATLYFDDSQAVNRMNQAINGTVLPGVMEVEAKTAFNGYWDNLNLIREENGIYKVCSADLSAAGLTSELFTRYIDLGFEMRLDMPSAPGLDSVQSFYCYDLPTIKHEVYLNGRVDCASKRIASNINLVDTLNKYPMINKIETAGVVRYISPEETIAIGPDQNYLDTNG